MSALHAVPATAPPTIGCTEAERALLGCLLTLPAEHATALLEHVQAEDLVDPRHRHVLDAIRVLVQQGIHPDPVAVLGELRRAGAGTTSSTGPGVLLADLYAAAPHTTSGPHYLRIVLEHALRRRIEEAGVRLQQQAATSGLADLLDLVRREVADVQAAEQRLGGGR